MERGCVADLAQRMGDPKCLYSATRRLVEDDPAELRYA
jgi:hypothetical protein